jgi:hypothetical protein
VVLSVVIESLTPACCRAALAWSQWDETSIEWRYGISRRLESIDKIKATKKVGLTAILETTIAEAKLTPGTQTCTHASSLLFLLLLSHA